MGQGLAVKVIGLGEGAIMLTSRPDVKGTLRTPETWYGPRLTSIFMRLGSLKEIPTVLDDLILVKFRDQVLDYFQDWSVMFLRGITLGEDEDGASIDRLKPKLLPGHRDTVNDEINWPLAHPGARVYKQEGREFTQFCPSDHLCTILAEQAVMGLG